MREQVLKRTAALVIALVGLYAFVAPAQSAVFSTLSPRQFKSMLDDSANDPALVLLNLPDAFQLGFDRVYHLETGLVGWIKENYPLVRQTNS